MELTQDDVPICRILFNEDTHAMALAMYGERAREIYEYIHTSHFHKDFFKYPIGDAFEKILRKEPLASFFFDNNLINFSFLSGDDITYPLIYSPICEKIWDSGSLDLYLYKLDGYYIYRILTISPICDKIWNSGKLYPYLTKLNDYYIELVLSESPIANKIKQSGKLNF